jgi:hypothetical protein
MVKRKDYSIYAKKRNEHYVMRKALLSNSFHDYIAAEIVYTPEHAIIVQNQMQKEVGFSQSDLAEYGEVLAFRGTESPSLNQTTQS